MFFLLKIAANPSVLWFYEYKARLAQKLYQDLERIGNVKIFGLVFSQKTHNPSFDNPRRSVAFLAVEINDASPSGFPVFRVFQKGADPPPGSAPAAVPSV